MAAATGGSAAPGGSAAQNAPLFNLNSPSLTLADPERAYRRTLIPAGSIIRRDSAAGSVAADLDITRVLVPPR
jgi:hypothetical protein